MVDKYRQDAHLKWQLLHGGTTPADWNAGLKKPAAASSSASASSFDARKRPAAADDDDDVLIIDDGGDNGDEALARRLQAEEERLAPSSSKNLPIDSVEEDAELARLLQEEETKLMRRFSNPGMGTTDVDLVEPTPDIHHLFRSFNELYFEGKLDAVEVKWGPRMTLCAGQCVYSKNAGGDLIDTLLHEMIHAFLFVASNKRDREDHGPLFLAKMEEINRRAGTHISVYHNFRDEVDLYRVHWWKCSGICGSIIKRASNRAPGPNDGWWANHQMRCGGVYVKIKEPEKKPETRAKKPKPAAKAAAITTTEGGLLDKWIRGPAGVADTTRKRAATTTTAATARKPSPPPPPLERRREVIVLDSPPRPSAADDDAENFRLLDRRGSLTRIDGEDAS